MTKKELDQLKAKLVKENPDATEEELDALLEKALKEAEKKETSAEKEKTSSVEKNGFDESLDKLRLALKNSNSDLSDKEVENLLNERLRMFAEMEINAKKQVDEEQLLLEELKAKKLVCNTRCFFNGVYFKEGDELDVSNFKEAKISDLKSVLNYFTKS